MISTRFHGIVCLACLLATSIVPPAGAEQKAAPANEARPALTPAEIRAAIAQLDDNRYLVRERATRQLLEAGPAALGPLLATADADRPEPSDRAIWILRRLSTAKEPVLRRQALEQLANLKKRPQVAAAARETLIELEHQEALAAIEQLGGRYIEGEYTLQFGLGRVGRLDLDNRWQGGDAGLAHLRHLSGLRQVNVIGTDISVEGFKELRHCESLQELRLYGTKVQGADLDKLRKVLPGQVEIDFRRGALLGVGPNTLDGVGPAIVGSVQPGSAAAAAGIQKDDVIRKFQGSQVSNFKSLTQKISDHQPGDEVSVEILRNGQPLEFKVKLGQWKMID